MATTPWIAGLYADLFAYKSNDARAVFPQLEDEQTRTVLVPVAPRMEWDELFRWQGNRDVRVSVLTLEQETGLLPVPPKPGWYEVEWQRWFGSQVQNQTQEIDFGFLPILPLRAWEDWDWNKDFTDKRFWLESDAPTGALFLPSTAWLEESAAAFTTTSGSLAAMVLLDEFVNAPSGGSTFGPAPRGRSVRFGFSISSFR